jgi:pimeloyl-ACP methyl ester carboxylesterase
VPTIKVNDINMYYEIHGDGEPLVLIQGLGFEISAITQGKEKSDYLDKYAQKYKVIVFDNRGVGRTDKPDIPYSIEMMAEDTLNLLDLLGIKHAHFLASSMGSCIALMLAAKHPERVRSLVLHIAFHRVPFPKNLIWGLMWKMPGSKKQMNKGAEFLFQQQYPPTLESFVRQGLAPLKFDGRKLLGQIKAPTLIVNGTKDQVISMKITRELAQGIPGARLILVEGDHLFIAQDINLLLKPALEFLADVAERSDLAAQNAVIGK